MATIHVPAPPATAFHKERPISDLLRGQLRHFEHIESRLPAALRSTIPPRDRLTEDGAARYIAHLTQALQTQAQAAQPVPQPVLVPARPAPRKAPIPITLPAIAAAAAPEVNPAKPKPSNSTPPKSRTSRPRGKKP